MRPPRRSSCASARTRRRRRPSTGVGPTGQAGAAAKAHPASGLRDPPARAHSRLVLVRVGGRGLGASRRGQRELATATFAVSPSRARDIRLTTPLGYLRPRRSWLPILSQSRRLTPESSELGFDEAYTIEVTNRGTLPTTGTITVTDVLSVGFTFVRVSGRAGVSAHLMLTCRNGEVLQPSTSSSYVLTVTGRQQCRFSR